MRFSTVVVFVAAMVQLHYHPVFAQYYYDESCVNPDGQQGICKSLQLCEPLLQLFRQYGSAVNHYIQKSICGFNGHDSRVCCLDAVTEAPQINRYSDNNNNRYGPLLAPQCGIADPVVPEVKSLVVGGKPADLGEWPWLAVLGYKDSRNPGKPTWLCGGSLISTRHVLTAAHCVHGRNDLYLVRLGEHKLGEDDDGASPIDVGIQKFSVHPQYNPKIFINDLAVLKLQRDVEFTRFIRPICLPVTENLRQQSFVNTFPFIAGWGAFYFTPIVPSNRKPNMNPIGSFWDTGSINISLKTTTDQLHGKQNIDMDVTSIQGGAHIYILFSVYAVGFSKMLVVFVFESDPIGHGLNFAGPRSNLLQKVQVPIVSQGECQQAFKKFKNVTIDHRVACGGFEQGGKGACQGDSGGPIMLKEDKAYYAIAVISYGYKCATPGIPGVFTRTSAFLDFILSLLN